MTRRVLGAVVALMCVALLSSCSLLPDVPSPGSDDTGQKVDLQMLHIADAVKHHDAAALEMLFSPAAREKATDLDSGLKYFLSVFPTGQMTWKLEPGGLGGSGLNEILSHTWESFAFYEVSAGGKKYDLYFADVITDTAHPNYLGVYALGVAPYNPDPATKPTASSNAFSAWIKKFQLSSKNVVTGTPGVYVPQK